MAAEPHPYKTLTSQSGRSPGSGRNRGSEVDTQLRGNEAAAIASSGRAVAGAVADLAPEMDERRQRRRRRGTAAFAGRCRSRPEPGPPRRRGGTTAAGARSDEAVASAAATSCLLSLTAAALSKRPSPRLHDRARRSNSHCFRRRAAPAQIQARAAWARHECFGLVPARTALPQSHALTRRAAGGRTTASPG